MKERQSPPPPPPVGSLLSAALCPGWPHVQMGGIFTAEGPPDFRQRRAALSQAAHPPSAAGGLRKGGTADLYEGFRHLHVRETTRVWTETLGSVCSEGFVLHANERREWTLKITAAPEHRLLEILTVH